MPYLTTKAIANRPIANYNDTRCADCHTETNHQRTKNAEWYIVRGDIWDAAILNVHADFLCIGCLEKRLGRQLTPTDFSDVPLNKFYGYCRSKRLRNRMGINFR